MKISDVLPRSRQEAISLSELSNILEKPERSVSRLINEERLSGVPICSNKNHPAGFWLTNSRTELDACSRTIRQEGLTRLRTATALQKIKLPGEPEQQRLK